MLSMRQLSNHQFNTAALCPPSPVLSNRMLQDGYGGCIAFDTGDRFHWGISSRRASMTYLHARNVTFRAGALPC